MEGEGEREGKEKRAGALALSLSREAIVIWSDFEFLREEKILALFDFGFIFVLVAEGHGVGSNCAPPDLYCLWAVDGTVLSLNEDG